MTQALAHLEQIILECDDWFVRGHAMAAYNALIAKEPIPE